MKIKCKCGCGKKILQKDNYGRLHFFVSGHNRKGVFSGKYVKCNNCQKIVYRKPCGLKKSKYFFCSKKCFYEFPHYWHRGKNHYLWKPFFKCGKNNKYKGIKIHNHPMADNQHRILEHRFIMSKKIGRMLDKKEVVHHKNGNPLDNNINNLVLCKNSSEHIKKYHNKHPYKKRKLYKQHCAIPIPFPS